MERPKTIIVIDEFQGMASNRGRFARQPGEASLLDNMHSQRQGELSVRKGFRVVASGAGAVESMFYYDKASPVLLCVVGGTINAVTLS
jgi:hypothetical protein